MIGSMRRLAWGVAACAAWGCAPAPPSNDGAVPAVGGSPPAGTSNYTTSHHGLLAGTVTDPAGVALDSIEVVTWSLAAPGAGSLPNIYRLSGRDGAVSLPVQLTAPAHRQGETFTVPVVVRGYAFSPRHRCGGEPIADSTVVPVRLVPSGHEPPLSPLHLVIPVRRC
jgi:hypothetical protein